MKFDWKDALLLIAPFILLNAGAAYILWEINPMMWPKGARLEVLLIYAVVGWVPLMLRVILRWRSRSQSPERKHQ